jgi:hypothetical protein
MLITTPNVDDPDAIFEALVRLHDGADDAESRRRNARLILLLVNHIGNAQVVNQAISVARDPQPA